MPCGISRDGSSSSDSGGGGVAVGAGWGAIGARVGAVAAAFSRVAARVAEAESVFSAAFFSISGGKSVELCLPSVQGGISRNSSKVKTRGLQHFQPKVE